MSKAVYRAYAHAWLAVGWLFAILLLLPLVKCVQVYVELRTDHPQDSSSEHVRMALTVGLYRRLDDPSLWAIGAAMFAAFLLGRAIVHVSQSVSFKDYLWTRSSSAWIRVVLWTAALIAIYLIAVYCKQETFWFNMHPEHVKYKSTLIPQIQWFEGCLNVLAILIGSSLVAPAFAIRRMIESAPNAATDIHIRRAASRLATLGVSPIIAYLFASVIFGVLYYFFKVGPIDRPSDIGTGVSIALLLTMPTLVSTWPFWLKPKKWGVSLGTLTLLGLLIFGGVCVKHRDIVTPPVCLLDRSHLPSPLWVPAVVLEGLGYVFTAVMLLWFYAY